jgi:acyl carrier protein
MTKSEIRARIKEIISKVAGIDEKRIGDDDSLVDDLRLDSLSMLEVGVDVDLAFALNLPDESYREVSSVPSMVELVARRLAHLGGGAGEPGGAGNPGNAGDPGEPGNPGRPGHPGDPRRHGAAHAAAR